MSDKAKKPDYLAVKALWIIFGIIFLLEISTFIITYITISENFPRIVGDWWGDGNVTFWLLASYPIFYGLSIIISFIYVKMGRPAAGKRMAWAPLIPLFLIGIIYLASFLYLMMH